MEYPHSISWGSSSLPLLFSDSLKADRTTTHPLARFARLNNFLNIAMQTARLTMNCLERAGT